MYQHLEQLLDVDAEAGRREHKRRLHRRGILPSSLHSFSLRSNVGRVTVVTRSNVT